MLSIFHEMNEHPPVKIEGIPTIEEARMETSNLLENSTGLALSQGHLLLKDGNYQSIANVGDNVQFLCQISLSISEHSQNKYDCNLKIAQDSL